MILSWYDGGGAWGWCESSSMQKYWSTNRKRIICVSKSMRQTWFVLVFSELTSSLMMKSSLNPWSWGMAPICSSLLGLKPINSALGSCPKHSAVKCLEQTFKVDTLTGPCLWQNINQALWQGRSLGTLWKLVSWLWDPLQPETAQANWLLFTSVFLTVAAGPEDDDLCVPSITKWCSTQKTGKPVSYNIFTELSPLLLTSSLRLCFGFILCHTQRWKKRRSRVLLLHYLWSQIHSCLLYCTCAVKQRPPLMESLQNGANCPQSLHPKGLDLLSKALGLPIKRSNASWSEARCLFNKGIMPFDQTTPAFWM